jgi:MFS family permease
VFSLFFLCGLVVGLWSAGLPSLNDRLDLGPARLGSVLLLLSGGALVSMLVAGPLVDKWSSKAVCWFAGPASAVVLLGPALAGSYPVLALLAVVFGMGIGVLEVAMNSHSVEVERAYGRPVISAFHGTWSLGGAAGGALTALILKAGLDAQALLVVAAIVVPFLYLPATRLLLPAPAPAPPADTVVDEVADVVRVGAGNAAAGDAADIGGAANGGGPETGGGPEAATGKAATGKAPTGKAGDGNAGGLAGGGIVGKAGALRWGLVALLGVAAFAGHLAEGAAMDWASLHARWVLHADAATAPLAYTIFSVAMTTVRLLGDPIRGRLGSVRTIRLAGILATCGYALVLVSPLVGEGAQVVVAWSGWALAGVGLATVVPVLFSAVGASGGPVGRGLALVTAFGYSGLLLGPAVLGYIAESSSLPVALFVPAVLAAVVALAGVPAIRSLLRVSPPAPVRD